jgi:hypothetical protein
MSDSDKCSGDRGFFRCPVPEVDSEGTITIRRKQIPVKVQDKSIDGFSILVEPKHVNKLRVGPQWILRTKDETTEVWAQWMFHSPEGHVQLGLRRLRDLTPLPKCSLLPSIGAYRKHTTNPELLIAAIVLTLFMALSLPGIGDHLGTSGKIQNGLRIMYDTATSKY